MTAPTRYPIPAGVYRSEIMVINSRFITTIYPVASVEAVKERLSAIRAEMPDASHHVYAFRVGFGNSVTEGMSDDGEPSGTAGPPVMAVLRGANVGDVLVVVTRYFGGTKLGTGGLVRAYGDAARTGLGELKTEEKVVKKLLGIEVSYHFYEQLKRLIKSHNGEIQDETFLADVTVMASFPVEDIPVFTQELSEATAGRVQPVMMDE